MAKKASTRSKKSSKGSTKQRSKSGLPKEPKAPEFDPNSPDWKLFCCLRPTLGQFVFLAPFFFVESVLIITGCSYLLANHVDLHWVVVSVLIAQSMSLVLYAVMIAGLIYSIRTEKHVETIFAGFGMVLIAIGSIVHTTATFSIFVMHACGDFDQYEIAANWGTDTSVLGIFGICLTMCIFDVPLMVGMSTVWRFRHEESKHRPPPVPKETPPAPVVGVALPAEEFGAPAPPKKTKKVEKPPPPPEPIEKADEGAFLDPGKADSLAPQPAATTGFKGEVTSATGSAESGRDRNEDGKKENQYMDLAMPEFNK